MSIPVYLALALCGIAVFAGFVLAVMCASRGVARGATLVVLMLNLVLVLGLVVIFTAGGFLWYSDEGVGRGLVVLLLGGTAAVGALDALMIYALVRRPHGSSVPSE